VRVELLATEDCPHVQRAEDIARAALSDNGHSPKIDRVYIGDLDDAAGLIGIACRLYAQPDGTLDGVIPAETIHAELERRREAVARGKAAASHPSQIPAKTSRAVFLWASRRRALGRVSTAIPFTRRMVRRFVPGDNLEDALGALESLKTQGMRWTVDVLGESVDSRETATAAADRYIATLDALAERGLEANVSLKLTAMGLDIDPDFCLANVSRVVARAREIGAFVRVDMEDHTKTEKTLAIARALHIDYADVGVVIQSYLRRSAADIAQANDEQMRVRLCKGAYDEPASVAFASKEEVDASYRELMEALVLHGRYPALATHDEALIEHAIAFVRENGISPSDFEFQMLYGVRRDLQERLVADGWTVRVYVPYGTEWYPYYMRRLAERPQNVLFMLFSVLNEGRGKKA